MRMPPYLLLRPSGYYFRFVIPHDLRDRFGKSEIRKSLFTHDRRQALLMAATLSDNVHQNIRSLRNGMVDIFDIDPKKIRKFEVEEMQVGSVKLTGVKVDSNNPNDVAAFNQVLDRLEKMSPATSAVATSTNHAMPAPTAGAGQNMLSQIFPIYLRHRKNAGISQHSINDFTSAYNLLIDVIGDKPITHISQDDANHFADIIQQLPPNRNKIAAYRDKPIDEVIKIRKQLEDAENNKRELAANGEFFEKADYSMSARTVDKHIGILGTFFKWALGKRYIHGNNVFEGQKIQSKSERERDTQKARQPFTPEDLKTIFSRENYQSRKTPHDFWFPLIGLFSGMRLNEIAQLHITDIYEKNGIWTFDLNQDTPDKKLKNFTSKRLVPIHSQLLALGFLEFYEDMKKLGKTRLFPNLTYVEGSYGRQPGRNFADYLHTIKITDKEKVFHSFRHTFNDTLKQHGQIGDEARSELMGHTHPTVNSSVYASTHRLSNKKQFIEKLDYEGLFLNMLRYHSGQFDGHFTESTRKTKINKPQNDKHAAARAAREERYRNAGKKMPG